MSVQIIKPAVARRLRITPGMVEDFVWDPCLAAWFFLGIKFDLFQRVRLKTFWLVPLGIDSSGFTSGKTIVDWAYMQLRCLLIPEHIGVVYYPSFQTGIRTFWPYYYRVGGNQYFRAHLGRLDEEGEEEGKAKTRAAGCYVANFRNGSRVEMPAPSIMKESTTQLSTRFNTSLFEEWPQFDAAGDSINRSLITRNTKPSFGNQHHPLWTNHVKFTATAKTQLHPAFARVRKIDAMVRKGNPKVFHIRFSYKDFSPGFKDADGRDVRMDDSIRTARGMMTESEWLGEAFGIWGKNTSGWYPENDLLRCVEIGSALKIRPAASRSEDARWMNLAPAEAEAIRYFEGVDPAPAQSARNDDGAIAILRARPLIRPESGYSDSPGDYDLSWAKLRRLRDADSSEWSGLMHESHRAFVLAKILMDMGAAGGGLFVKKDLAKPRQKINGVEGVECTPILSLEDMGVRGHFILHAFKRKDPGIERLWGQMAGDDVLLDTAHVEMRSAVQRALPKWPKRYTEWTQEELLNMGEENIWSLRNLDTALDQFGNIGVAMSEDRQSYDLTKNGARQFHAAKGKKDFQMAMMLAWIAFLIWLRYDAGALTQKEEDMGMIWGG